MNNFMEFSNQSSLDHVNINIRWLKEWRLTDVHHRHLFIFPYTAFWLVLSGTATIELNHVPYKVKAGDIVSIPSKSAQSWKEVGQDEPFCYLSLACEATIGVIDLIRSYSFPPIVSDIPQEEINRLIAEWRCLADEYNDFIQLFDDKDVKSMEKGSGSYPVFKLNTDQTIRHLRIRAKGTLWVQLLCQTLRSRLPDEPVAFDNRVFEVCDYVEKRLHEPPTLDEMADFVSLSKEQLRTLFQAAYGISPVKYVRHVRLQRARDLLMLTSYPLKEIARMIGFQDQHHFSRAFQQAENISPQAYRKRIASRE
ncbi:AraC family transcriptional regulator [Paenibacillus glycanilyticus]|uniref:AraC family transcriptional regulator n=1 Tax=Paenibacillus glycanilyticus TaxID=126569 RepID=UPI0013E2ACF1|nr:AraC family transcriptional regulator [Paenibacillus glycanilyticus]